MPAETLEKIAGTRPRNVRLMGLDLGTKTIGVAISDSAHSIATPVRVVQRTKFTRDIVELGKIIRDYDIGGYVLGYPLNMDGTMGPRCDAVQSFAAEMLNHPDIFGEKPWIALWDERLSTAAMTDFLIDTVDISRTKRKQVIDKLAAQYILQGALDFIQAGGL